MKRFVKFLKVSGITLAGLFLILFLYSNFKHRDVDAKIKPIKLVGIRTEQPLEKTTASDLEKKLSKLQGVSACAVNPKAGIIGLAYYPDQTTFAAITHFITTTTGIAAKQITYNSNKPGCPVHGVLNSFNKVTDALYIR